MSVKVLFGAVSGADHYTLERGVTSSSFSVAATVTASIGASNYDQIEGAYYYNDPVGTSTSWYRVCAVDTVGQSGSFSDPFQVGNSYVGSVTTLSKLKEYLGVTSTTDDVLMNRLIAGASTWFNNQVGLDIVATIYQQVNDGEGTRSVILKHFPITSVSSVVVDGVTIPQRTSVTGSGWVLKANNVSLTPDYSFTDGLQNVVITYTAGYDVIPYDVEQAVIEMAAMRYRERTRIGVMSNTVGGESVSYQTVTIPVSVQSVVDSYKRMF